ncbi:uncharacterized protein LOC143196298 [Rhynchophorus ferrugineus]|uniref:Cyclic nucleotide-binding domain-containing protein n=1 Tax=Rhynchophorus ferrugineus TaxID=354439 RepID=A0A834II73_RHYFE|nr:hypothetical protein GWI33_007659 [Rhynchophorus ferrugineus]
MSQRKKPPGLTPEERAARDARARRKFKAIARLVMANLFWLGDLDDTLGENVMLNIQKLTRKKIKKSSLTTKEKLILTKPKEERTDEEKHLLNRAIGGLRCFRRYPPNVKSQLAAVTYFVYIGPDRVIVKQDHAPTAMYFLLSGEGVVTVKTYDKMLKEWLEEEHGFVGPGTMFGEVALIHGIARTATITTTMPCELLMIKKEDFDIVLKDTVWKAWEQIAKIMKRYSYFKNWDAVTKRECSIISRTKTYLANEVILGDEFGLPNYSYLITKGTCSIIEHLQTLVIVERGLKKYKLYIPDPEDDKPAAGPTSQTQKKVSDLNTPKIETHFIKVCEMKEGAIFNVGETFDRRRVVSNTSTNCLLIPRYWLVKMNKGNIWNRVQQFLNKNIPSTKQIFNQWIKDKKFTEYKRSLVRDLLAEKKLSQNNSIHNVPYSIRLKDGGC